MNILILQGPNLNLLGLRSSKTENRLTLDKLNKRIKRHLRKIADNVEYKMPPTIDDPAILDEIKKDLKDNNILKT